MQYRQRLRSRIIISFLVFGTLLSALFATSIMLTRDYLEDELLGKELAENLNTFAMDVRTDPLRRTTTLSNRFGAVANPSDLSRVPEVFRDLEPGVHNVEWNNTIYKVAVRKDDDLWFYIAQDLSNTQRLEELQLPILVGAVLVFSGLSFVLGFWSSRRVMAPVTALAQRIESLSQQKRMEELAQYFADDEVGQVAEALDDYARRLTELVERDKEFNADVSHELRTPLSVIKGATELLLAQPDLDERVRRRLIRVERACQQSIELTTALLHLARDQKADEDTGEVHSMEDIVDQVVEFQRPQLGNKAVEVDVQVREPLKVRAPLAVLTVAVGNLVGNAFKYTSEGKVTIILERKRLVVEDTGPGVEEEELPRIFSRHYRGKTAGSSKGSGLGLAIVKRLCDLYGWQVTATSRGGRGLRAELMFSVPDRQAAA